MNVLVFRLTGDSVSEYKCDPRNHELRNAKRKLAKALVFCLVLILVAIPAYVFAAGVFINLLWQLLCLAWALRERSDPPYHPSVDDPWAHG